MHADSSSTRSNNIDPSFADTSSGGDTADMQKTSAVAEQKQIRMDDDITSGVLDYILCVVCRLENSEDEPSHPTLSSSSRNFRS